MAAAEALPLAGAKDIYAQLALEKLCTAVAAAVSDVEKCRLHVTQREVNKAVKFAESL